jgi:hypothetical protein
MCIAGSADDIRPATAANLLPVRARKLARYLGGTESTFVIFISFFVHRFIRHDESTLPVFRPDLILCDHTRCGQLPAQPPVPPGEIDDCHTYQK